MRILDPQNYTRKMFNLEVHAYTPRISGWRLEQQNQQTLINQLTWIMWQSSNVVRDSVSSKMVEGAWGLISKMTSDHTSIDTHTWWGAGKEIQINTLIHTYRYTYRVMYSFQSL